MEAQSPAVFTQMTTGVRFPENLAVLVVVPRPVLLLLVEVRVPPQPSCRPSGVKSRSCTCRDEQIHAATIGRVGVIDAVAVSEENTSTGLFALHMVGVA